MKMMDLHPLLHPDYPPNLRLGGLLFEDRNWPTFQQALTVLRFPGDLAIWDCQGWRTATNDAT
jgi:hypothetical protein